MLRTGVVVDAVETPLHDGPNTLNAVCVRRSTGVFPGAVVHALMPEEQAVPVGKDGVIVSVQCDPASTLPWMASSVRSVTTLATVRTPCSRIPKTAALPTGPRPAFSLFRSCSLASFPPLKHSSISMTPSGGEENPVGFGGQLELCFFYRGERDLNAWCFDANVRRNCFPGPRFASRSSADPTCNRARTTMKIRVGVEYARTEISMHDRIFEEQCAGELSRVA